VIPLSILDLRPIVEGGDAAQSLRNSLNLARHAERNEFYRFLTKSPESVVADPW
jgi:hypothetical protein